MKDRTSVFVWILVLFLGLAACSKKEEPESALSRETAATPAVSAQPAVATEAVMENNPDPSRQELPGVWEGPEAKVELGKKGDQYAAFVTIESRDSSCRGVVAGKAVKIAEIGNKSRFNVLNIHPDKKTKKKCSMTMTTDSKGEGWLDVENCSEFVSGRENCKFKESFASVPIYKQ